MTWVAEKRSGGESLIKVKLITRPTVKEELKRNMKELSTAARFGMFRAKKKLLRKAEL